MITQEYLKSVFDYNGKDLVWKASKGLAKANEVAGTLNSRGYRHIRLDMKFYQAHRLVWIYHKGFLNDDAVIDHINRDRSDNRIENLRLCSTDLNNLNRKVSSNSSTGIKNIYKTKAGLFYVECRLYGKQHRTAKFKTFEEAAEIRDAFVQNIHKEFSA